MVVPRSTIKPNMKPLKSTLYRKVLCKIGKHDHRTDKRNFKGGGRLDVSFCAYCEKYISAIYYESLGTVGMACLISRDMAAMIADMNSR